MGHVGRALCSCAALIFCWGCGDNSATGSSHSGGGTGAAANTGGKATDGSTGGLGASGGTGGSAGSDAGGVGGSTGGAAGSVTGGAAGSGTGGAAGGGTDGGGAGGTGGTTGGTGGTDAAACVAPVQGPCDTFPQCGCAANHNCVVVDTAGTTDCVAAGSVPKYGYCTDSGQCGIGYSCYRNVCKPFCAATSDCAAISSYSNCGQVTDISSGTVKPIPEYKLCSSGCDPLVASTCGPGTGCFIVGFGTADCRLAGSAVGVDGCKNDQYACAPGYLCTVYDSCEKYCRVGMNDCGSQTCVQLLGPVVYQGATWGTCE
jgi:hypothetical protein